MDNKKGEPATASVTVSPKEKAEKPADEQATAEQKAEGTQANPVTNVVKGAADAVAGAADSVGNAVAGAADAVSTDAKDAADKLGNAAENIKEKVTGQADEAKKAVEDAATQETAPASASQPAPAAQ